MYTILILLALLGVTLAAPSKSVVAPGHNIGIIGGNPADISNHPWQVSVQHENTHFCGGILIAPNWVLTAAHCIVDGYNAHLNIRAGSSQTSSDGQTATVNEYFVHPRFNNTILDNDITLLKLATPITNVNATVATLPKTGETVPIGASLFVSGWGATSVVGPIVERLLEVTVPTVDRDYCKKANAFINEVTENMFCAGYTAGGKDSCYGDSGGPASIDGVVVGIVSWSNGCGEPNYPGVYTKISNYRDWIAQYAGV